MDTITITGVEQIAQRLAGLNANMRKKILRKSASVIAKNSKARITNATDLQGQAWSARSAKAPPEKKKKKMEAGLKKRLTVVFVSSEKAVIGFKKGQEKRVAAIQQKGFSTTVQVSRTNPKRTAPATKEQARQLQALGYKINNKKVSIGYITGNLTQGKAGLIIRILENRPKKTSYNVTLPPRSFLGITETDLTQIMSIIDTEIQSALRGNNGN